MVSDTVTLRNGLGPRIALAVMLLPTLFALGVNFRGQLPTHWGVQEIHDLLMTYLMVSGLAVLGWTTVSWNEASVTVHVPTVFKRSVQWSEVASYKKGWMGNGLYGEKAKLLIIPGHVPQLKLLWDECERRGIQLRK